MNWRARWRPLPRRKARQPRRGCAAAVRPARRSRQGRHWPPIWTPPSSSRCSPIGGLQCPARAFREQGKTRRKNCLIGCACGRIWILCANRRAGADHDPARRQGQVRAVFLPALEEGITCPSRRGCAASQHGAPAALSIGRARGGGLFYRSAVRGMHFRRPCGAAPSLRQGVGTASFALRAARAVPAHPACPPCADESYADETVLENIGGEGGLLQAPTPSSKGNLPLKDFNPYRPRRLCQIKTLVLERLFEKKENGCRKCSSLFLGSGAPQVIRTSFSERPVFQPLDPEHRLSPRKAIPACHPA